MNQSETGQHLIYNVDSNVIVVSNLSEVDERIKTENQDGFKIHSVLLGSIDKKSYNMIMKKEYHWFFSSASIMIRDSASGDLEHIGQVVYYVTKIMYVLQQFGKIELIMDDKKYNRSFFSIYGEHSAANDWELDAKVIRVKQSLTIPEIECQYPLNLIHLDTIKYNKCDWCFGRLRTLRYGFHICVDCNRIDRTDTDCGHSLEKQHKVCDLHHRNYYWCKICNVYYHQSLYFNQKNDDICRIGR